jgi:hypothetical protein
MPRAAQLHDRRAGLLPTQNVTASSFSTKTRRTLVFCGSSTRRTRRSGVEAQDAIAYSPPDHTVLVGGHYRATRWASARHPELFRLRVEHADPIGAVLAEPEALL